MNDVYKRKITLFTCPIDLRQGGYALRVLAKRLGIDVSKGKDLVVFLSMQRRMVKIIWDDDYSSYTTECRLHRGLYQHLMTVVGADDKHLELNSFQLNLYLKGNKLQYKNYLLR